MEGGHLPSFLGYLPFCKGRGDDHELSCSNGAQYEGNFGKGLLESRGYEKEGDQYFSIGLPKRKSAPL